MMPPLRIPGQLPRPRRLAGLALTLGAAATVAACSMAGSALLDPKSPQSCSGNLGTYYLSRSLLKVEVQRYATSTPATPATPPEGDNRFRLVLEGLYREADPERIYCLDYLQALTSDDLIRVWRNNQGLLQKISSDANDQSAEILKTIIQTIFTAISGNPDFDPLAGQRSLNSGSGETVKVFEAKFDPTNAERLAYINDHLRQYGFCLLSKAQYQALGRGNDGPIQNYEAYCENPTGHLPSHRVPPAAKRKQLEVSDGIVYRPQLPYDLILLQRSNQKLDVRRVQRGEPLWLVTKRKLLLIENDAPAIAARIDRTFFAQRTTTLMFENGLLKEVKLQKEAELVNLVEIPLQIAESIASLPANIVKVRIDQSSGQAQLIKAETDLMRAQERLIQQTYMGADVSSQKAQLESYVRDPKSVATGALLK